MNSAARLQRDGRFAMRADGSMEVVFDPAGATVAHARDPAEIMTPGAAGQRGPALSCGGGGCGLCSAGLFGQGRVSRLRFAPDSATSSDCATVRSGARVEVSIAASGLARIAARAFGVPLAGLCVGAGLGHLAGSEGFSILLGSAGLAAGLTWLRLRGGSLVSLLDIQLRPRTADQGALRPWAGLDDEAGCRPQAGVLNGLSWARCARMRDWD
jgi:positive regulator of sigma E activity